MNSNNIRRVTLALFVGVVLSAVLEPAVAITPSQIPLNIGVSAAKPNIMLMVDSSGSMTSNVTTTNPASLPSAAPSNFTYNCKTAVPAGSPVPMVVNSTGTPRFCKSSSSCTNSNQTNFSKNKCFNNTSSYTVFYVGTTSQMGPYTGLQLNWYFSTNNFVLGSLAGVLTTTSKRIDIAKQAANDLVDSLASDPGGRATVRMGLARYDSSSSVEGGMLLSEIKDLDSIQATVLTTGITNIPTSGNTPLATTLSDIGKYFAIGETGNLKLHPNATTPTSTSIDTIFSKANGTTPHSITNATCGSSKCTNTLAAPILGYCQKSYAILISDGLPNGDREISPSLRDYTGDCATKGLCVSTPDNAINLPGGGGVPLTATGTACNNNGNWGNKFCKNGTKAGRIYEQDGSDYLDDVAQALYEMDLRPSLDATKKAETVSKNNLVTYAIGLADPTLQQESVLKDAALAGGGKFFFAEDSKALASALEDTIADIASKVSSSASVVANSSKLDANSAIYQGKYDSADWTGILSMFPLGLSEDVNGNGVLDAGEDINGNGRLDVGEIGDALWNAAEHIPAFDSTSGRNILTYNFTATPKGVAFTCANLTASQKTALGIIDCANTADIGVWRLNYIRGDWSHEEKNPTRTDADTLRSSDPAVGIFRNRTHLNKKTQVKIAPDPWLLGDIVNSNPAYVSDENYRYDKLSAADGGTLYKQFVTDNATRRKMVYVGANDGMLHGFDATSGIDGGKEILAYIPNAVYNGLNGLSSPSYTHQYLVDGSPRIADAFIGGAWHTLLVSTTGAGGKAVFALDATNPSSFGGSNVLWELSDTQSPNATDLTTDTTALRGFAKNLGYTMPQPSIVKMKDGSWAAVVANGYDSVNNLAVLYIINVQTGNIIAAIDTKAGGATTPNGLSTPITVDSDGDKIVDAIYAGDLLGNLWKFDVSSTNPSAWVVANGGSPLFIACSNPSACDTTRQPITGKPQISGVNTKIGQKAKTVMVYFGTGKYFETVDNNVTNAQTQTFYGIWDNNTTVAKTDLQAQTITDEIVQNGFNMRATSNNLVSYPTQKGWYMDLLKPSTTTSDGERVVSFPLFRGGRITFSTLIPIPPAGTDICGTGSEGTTWVMKLDAYTGSRSPDTADGTPWDINGDGVVDAKDLLLIGGKNFAASGKQSTVGSFGTVTAVTGSGGLGVEIGNGSKQDGAGEGMGVNSSASGMQKDIVKDPLSSGSGSRQSWRQLQ